MPRDLPEDHFRTGVWRGDTPGPALRHFTCTECGRRTPTWEAFRGHRRECPGEPGQGWTLERLLARLLDTLAPG